MAFFAYDRAWSGGVDVSGLDAISGERAGRIVVAAGPGGGPDVRIFDANKRMRFNYFAFDRAWRGGVHVDVWEDPDEGIPVILSTPIEGERSFVRRHTFKGYMLEETLFFENWWIGGFDVTTANGRVYLSTLAGRQAWVQSRNY